MATILRFIDEEAETTRLDLNDPAGFQLVRGGFRPGTKDVDFLGGWLKQAPHPGAIPAGPHRPQVEMLIRVSMTRQANWDDVAALMTTLAIELDRDTNVLEFRPEGASVSYLIDTYKSPIPSLFRGQESPSPETLLQDSEPMDLLIYRHPDMRGAGTHI